MVLLASTIPLLQGFAYLCTLVATLRASSRLTYMWLHNGTIGAMDGPLILSSSNDDDKNLLWEITYSLEKVVQLASTTDSFILTEDSARHKGISWTHKKVNKIMGQARTEDDEQLTSASYPSRSDDCQRKKTPFHIASLLSTAGSGVTSLTTEVNCILQKASQLPSYLYEMYPSFLHASWRRTASTNKFTTTSSVAASNSRNVAETPSAYHSFKEQIITLPTATKLLNNNNDKVTVRQAQITAIAPVVFQQLRNKYGINEEDYIQSLQTPFISFQSNSKGAARAGLTFFFTRDGAYMIKSIKRSEAETLLKILPSYNAYMKRHARRTLLTRICGLYEVSLQQSEDEDQSPNFSLSLRGRSKPETVTLLVMNSVFPALASHFISERYDLKGSTVGRECTIDEVKKKGLNNVVLKDLNLAKEVQRSTSSKNTNDYGLHLGTRAKASLLSQLRQDVMFLSQCGVMDYSLLVGIVNMQSARNKHLEFPVASDSFRKEQETLLHGAPEVNKNILTIHDNRKTLLSSLLRRTSKHVAALCSYPVHAIAAPLLYLLQKLHTVTEVTLSTVLTLPLPYYGAGICGVDGGALSVLHGRRCGQRAVYYLGLIDFLQPWTLRKVMERELKGLIGYNKHAISCVNPNEYSARFISFLDAHIT